MKSKPQEETIVDIRSVSHDGRGIALINGKTTFVEGALVGEKIRCRLTKKHSRYNEAKAIEVISASARRVTPACAHFGICGGCSLQHLAISEQIQTKQDTLFQQLKHFGNITPKNILPPLAANCWNYRRKARLGVRYDRKKETLFIGFREKNSNLLADIKNCDVLHSSIGTRIAALHDLIKNLDQFDQIPQIEVARGDDETALVFRHLLSLPDQDIEKLREFGKKYQFHIYLQPTLPALVHKIWPEDNNNRLSYSLSDYSLTMQFHPMDFIQVNNEINQQIIKRALSLLDIQSKETVLDLFCGLGNFTLPIARYAKHVTGIEGSKEMVARADENARLNHISNTTFYTANLMDPPKAAAWIQQQYDKILLDPPRTGAKEIIAFFPLFNAKKIVYVSCNPATFARDAKELVSAQGYTLTDIGVADMFPQTSHIEVVALFQK